jgi:plastocyanin
MTLRWLTSSKASTIILLACAGYAESLPGPALVTGQVELADSREASVRRAKNYAGVVVWLEPAGGAAPLSKSDVYTIRQKGKRFNPHILPVPVGATVDFPNFDPIFHNAFSNFAGQPFDTGLYRPGTSQKVQFRREGVVRVFCNIHSSMSAVIVVLDTPYYATSKADGSIRIEGVPKGDYTLHVWHERATQASLTELTRKIAISDASLELPVIRISESGYLEIPHKNKHGREYPPRPVEHSVYPGGRK